MKTQWNQWRPGYYKGAGQQFGAKGKGKGDEMNWMQGKGTRFSFPPLGAVGQGHDDQQDQDQNWNYGQDDWSQYSNNGVIIGAVTKKKDDDDFVDVKKKNRFQKTNLFDASLHKAQTHKPEIEL